MAVLNMRVLPVELVFASLVAWATPQTISGVNEPGNPENPTSRSVGQKCWDTSRSFELDCFHAEPLTLDPFPLNAEMLARAIPYPTSDVTIHRAFQRARENGVLRVVVLGGSVTFGHQCSSPAGLSGTECAWPRRLEQWFEERIRDFKVKVSTND